MKLYHFLGSLPLALFLIAATTLFVITGTFLESSSGSHRFAAHFTYSSPLFGILLGGFFINILISALRRWPFKKRHIPFLITHAGLLMVIGGAMIKHVYGIQGTMRISEGSGSEEVLLADTQAILVESKDHQSLYPIKQTLTGRWRLSQPKDAPLQLALTSYIPHATEHREIWKADGTGRLQRERLEPDAGQTLVVYDRGFGGYAVQVPETLSPEELDRQKLAHLNAQLHQARHEKLLPPLALLQRACQKTGADFPDTFATFLDAWNNSPSWLLSDVPPSIQTTLSHLNWNEVPPGELQGCLWLSALDRALQPRLQQGCNLLDLLKEHDWPFLTQLQEAKTNEEEQLLVLLTKQIFAVADDLPALPPDTSTPARLYSAYLRAYALHLKDIPFEPILKNVERPLTVSFEATSPLKKLEENRPVALLQARCKGKSCSFSLGFEPSGAGLKWPLFEGAFRTRFQPEAHRLPHHIRLRQARQITYAGASQPYSYECDLIIRSLDSGQAIEKTLSMNNVHETADGYRFYLSHIAPPQEGALKQIQLVVNSDPAKYWLTYPGGIILALGIALLFFLPRRN
ncbi:MAG: hypothetical protein LLG04_00660 [Parachlamydia sp.]|nr:hypothetical protein [Parachlamydia sp.]